MRLFLQITISVAVGLVAGWTLGTSELERAWGGYDQTDQLLDATPSVDSGSEWGQHTPRVATAQGTGIGQGLVRPNTKTPFNPTIESPEVPESAFLDPLSSVLGHVRLGEKTFVGPFASIRGDEGQPIRLGDESNVQDGVVIHALETFSQGKKVKANLYTIRGVDYAVYIGDRVSLAHQSQVHGPALIENGVFVGMQALVFRAHVGEGVVIEPGAKVIGVKVPQGRYVPAGMVLTSQSDADELPEITYAYGLGQINEGAVDVNTGLAESYSRTLPASRRR